MNKFSSHDIDILNVEIIYRMESVYGESRLSYCRVLLATKLCKKQVGMKFVREILSNHKKILSNRKIVYLYAVNLQESKLSCRELIVC